MVSLYMYLYILSILHPESWSRHVGKYPDNNTAELPGRKAAVYAQVYLIDYTSHS